MNNIALSKSYRSQSCFFIRYMLVLLCNSTRVIFAKAILYQTLLYSPFWLMNNYSSGKPFLVTTLLAEICSLNVDHPFWSLPFFLFRVEMHANFRDIKAFANKKLSREHCSGSAGFLQQCPSPHSEVFHR